MRQVLLITLLFIPLDTKSQEFNTVLKDKLDALIERYIDGIAPGMAVGIVQNGEITYQKFMGYANLENEIKINEKTSFNIASNAKQFTALCVLRLIEQGKLHLDDDIRRFLPDLYENIPSSITVTHLLTHTSGIRDVYELWALKGQTWWKLFVDNADAMDLLKSQTALNFEPGSAYLYSNSNYILLTEIIEAVTGKSFSEYALTMFTELGMSNSSFLTNYMAVIPQKARPYGNWNGWREYPSITEIHGDGALFTTLADQLKWEQIIQRNDGSLVKKELLDKSQSVVLNSTTDKYGYGLMFDQYQGLDYLFHDGNTGAYNATFFRFPHKNLAIVIMANNGNVSTTYLARQLTDIVFDLEESDAAVYMASPDRIEKLKNIQSVVGNYQQADGTVIRITAKEGAIYREIYQREPVKLVSEEGGLFHYETNEDLKLNFTNIDKTDQQLTLYLSSQAPSTFYKQADLNLDKTTLNGEFYNDETDTEIIIKHTEGNSYTITKNGRERNAKLILKDYLRMMSSYEIKAIRDHKNEVISLSVNNSRIKNVIFHKK